MSAPNGNRILTMKPRDPNQRNINTGKTAKKRGLGRVSVPARKVMNGHDIQSAAANGGPAEPVKDECDEDDNNGNGGNGDHGNDNGGNE